MGSRGLLFLTSAEQPHHQPLPHLCAVVQSDEFSCLLPTSPLHQQIPPLQPPPRAPRLLQSLHQAVPCLIHCSGGVQHSPLCFSPCVQRPPKNSNPLQLVCYICSQHLSGFCTQQRGGTGWSWGAGKLFTQPMLQEGKLLSQTK